MPNPQPMGIKTISQYHNYMKSPKPLHPLERVHSAK
jgi:hypothetical protein